MCMQLADPDDMYYEELAKKARYYKESEKGVKEMRDIVKELFGDEIKVIVDENTKEVREDIAKQLLQTDSLSLDYVAQCTRLPLSAVKELKEQMTQTA